VCRLITILRLGIVPGLEIAYKGDWINVQTVPNSRQINFSLQLKVNTFLQPGHAEVLNCSWFGTEFN
jgi:hypothetical protein